MDDVKLIELVREHPCVFNPKHHMYKDANARENVWIEIGAQMKTTADACKQRWKNIRDTFMRHKRSKKLHTASASSKKVRRWHLEMYLDFLHMVDCERETLTNNFFPELDDSLPDNSEEPEIAGNIQLARETNDYQIRDPLELGKDQLEDPELPNGDDVSKQSNKRKLTSKFSGESIVNVFKKNSEKRSKIMSSIVEKQKEQPKDQHPIDVFFQSMAMTVKQFSPANQVRARIQICQIVSNLELNEINKEKNVPQHDDRSSSSVSLHSSSPRYDVKHSPASRDSMFTVEDPSALHDAFELTMLD